MENIEAVRYFFNFHLIMIKTCRPASLTLESLLYIYIYMYALLLNRRAAPEYRPQSSQTSA